MKTKLLISLMMIVATFSHAQPKEPELPRGMIVIKEDDRMKAEEVYLLAVTATKVAYKFNVADADPEVLSRSEVDSIFLYEPRDYLEAMDLYEGRKYAEAKNALAAVKEKYGKAYPGINNNPGIMAAFYELECLRKLNDLEGLRLALQSFNKETLTHKVALQQLEIYKLWDMIRANLNQEAVKEVEKYKGKRLTGEQRAQIGYLHGRALEGLMADGLEEVYSGMLLAYQVAMTADAGGSEGIARDAALRSLAILDKDEDMKFAIKTFEESDGKEMVRGFTKAMEGAGLCKMFQLTLGAGEPLPSKYSYFLKYTAERVQEMAENGSGDDDDDKKKDKKDDKKKDKKDGE